MHALFWQIHSHGTEACLSDLFLFDRLVSAYLVLMGLGLLTVKHADEMAVLDSFATFNRKLPRMYVDLILEIGVSMMGTRWAALLHFTSRVKSHPRPVWVKFAYSSFVTEVSSWVSSFLPQFK